MMLNETDYRVKVDRAEKLSSQLEPAFDRYVGGMVVLSSLSSVVLSVLAAGSLPLTPSMRVLIIGSLWNTLIFSAYSIMEKRTEFLGVVSKLHPLLVELELADSARNLEKMLPGPSRLRNWFNRWGLVEIGLVSVAAIFLMASWEIITAKPEQSTSWVVLDRRTVSLMPSSTTEGPQCYKTQ